MFACFEQIVTLARLPFGESQPCTFKAAFDVADFPVSVQTFKAILEDDDARCNGFDGNEKKVSLVRNQQLVPTEEYATAQAAWELWRSGASAVFHYLQRYQPSVAAMCQTVANAVGQPVHANAYWTPPGHQGFPVHSDPDSVVAVQLQGDKRWPFFTPKAMSPDDADNVSWVHTEGRTHEIAPVSAAAHLLHAYPGDVLWSPRGWGHYAVAGRTDSLHISFGILHREIDDEMVKMQHPVYPQR